MDPWLHKYQKVLQKQSKRKKKRVGIFELLEKEKLKPPPNIPTGVPIGANPKLFLSEAGSHFGMIDPTTTTTKPRRRITPQLIGPIASTSSAPPPPPSPEIPSKPKKHHKKKHHKKHHKTREKTTKHGLRVGKCFGKRVYQGPRKGKFIRKGNRNIYL